MTDRYVHHIHTWGTVITCDLRQEGIDETQARAACVLVEEELQRIDAWLSPFRDDSAVTEIRRGTMTASTAPQPVREVIDGCARVTALTGGAFDPWKAPGGFDPSGYVKGWGADRAADILVSAGFANVSVNAAGDVTCRGEASPGLGGWRLGIADPRDRQQVLQAVLVTDAHLATSGRYEQGDHIVDPATGARATGVASATVLASDGGLADALATALLVQGAAGLTALRTLEASALVVQDDRMWTTGPAFAGPPIG